MKTSKLMRIFSVILLITLIGSFVIACSDTSEQKAVTTTAAGDTEAVTEAETKELEPNLPNEDYGGHVFTFLISSNAELGTVQNDIHAEEESGEPINDQRYLRNTFVEEKYNVVINDFETAVGHNGAGIKLFQTTVTAGDTTYDAAFMAGYDTCVLASNGFLYDMNNIPNIDLDQPWWDQKANADLMINNKMFYTTGSISTAINNATYAILFNKKLVEDYELEDYYALVNEGKWTIDKFCEAAVQVHQDLDGNGEFDINDLYGALLWDDTMMGVVNASGDKCATTTANGIELTINTPKVEVMIEKYFSVALDKEVCHTYQRKNWDGVAPRNMFSNNQSLFFLQMMSLVSEMRNMEADFGVLPYFKYDEAQEEYYHTVGTWHSVFLCVPTVQVDVERTGVILEALAAKSMYTVMPAFKEISLQNKYTRDEESAGMVDLILSTRIYDVGWYYQIGGYNEEVMNMLRNFRSEFTSMYAKFEKKAMTQIETINTAFAELE